MFLFISWENTLPVVFELSDLDLNLFRFGFCVFHSFRKTCRNLEVALLCTERPTVRVIIRGAAVQVVMFNLPGQVRTKNSAYGIVVFFSNLKIKKYLVHFILVWLKLGKMNWE